MANNMKFRDLIQFEQIDSVIQLRDAERPNEAKKLVSDVAAEVAEGAGWLSPRIGGVGPMTRAMLLVNTVEAAERRVEQG